MLLKYKTVYEGGQGELIEKKSRFIAEVMPVNSEEEAVAFIEQIKKKHWNATHNCFAYVIGDQYQIQRCSDDGEPSNTAGKPMLDVLMGEALYNTAVVVTRYFGGTLLGTGGLVRAYAGAVKAGLAASTIITKILGHKLLIQTDYTALGKIQYILGENGLTILNTEYTDQVTIQTLIPNNQKETICQHITEGTNGQAKMEWKKECYFAKVNKEIKIF